MSGGGRYGRTKKRFKKGGGGGGGGGGPRGNYAKATQSEWDQRRSRAAQKSKERQQQNEVNARLDTRFGYDSFTEGPPRTGWMFNVRPTSVFEEETGAEMSAVEMFFVEPDGATFKAQLVYRPYFLVRMRAGGPAVQEVESYMARRFEGVVAAVSEVRREDLDMPNHLSGQLATFVKLEFAHVDDLMEVRRALQPAVAKNAKAARDSEAYEAQQAEERRRREERQANADGDSLRASGAGNGGARLNEVLDAMVEMREYDVPYLTRVCIDGGYRVGLWYRVHVLSGRIGVRLEKLPDKVDRPILRVVAYDIETTKLPLKFPDSSIDAVMMISYMADNQGYLIVNREIVSEDIPDFEYTPKPEYEGPFKIFNEPNELATLRRFFEHMRELRPQIYVTYNGDFFDWPFVEDRARVYDLEMADEIGVWRNRAGEYMGRFCVHMDAFCWVRRDSYLPQGSQGLKAVTKAKLKYDPVELDPEEMLPLASSKPHVLASYSVSDAVATYYLYMKYVHMFIFSLCTVIPMPPADVLRKGSGTLCELLLMVQAYEGNIVCPNKEQREHAEFHKGHLLESQTYVGGHVESLESGVFRDDFTYKFRVDPDAMQMLIDSVDRTLRFAIENENDTPLSEVENLDEVREAVVRQLAALRDEPVFESRPLVYHLDVGAMYPNIILSNRLQPMAVVDQAACAACDHNRPSSNCKRPMQWQWRGKYFLATRADYEGVRSQLMYEPAKNEDGETVAFTELSEAEQAARVKKRVKEYSQKVYRRVAAEEQETRTATVCQRENPFYVDTVRAFRDRRYDYKRLTKTWKRKLDGASNAVEELRAKDMVLLYDSLQLAHKCVPGDARVDLPTGLSRRMDALAAAGATAHVVTVGGVRHHTKGAAGGAPVVSPAGGAALASSGPVQDEVAAVATDASALKRRAARRLFLGPERERTPARAVFVPTGRKAVCGVTLEDGRTLRCTRDHKVLVQSGGAGGGLEYVEAGSLRPGEHRAVVSGVATVFDDLGEGDPAWAFDAASLDAGHAAATARLGTAPPGFVRRWDAARDTLKAMRWGTHRDAMQALARLHGAAMTDGTSNGDQASVQLHAGDRRDAAAMLEDIRVLAPNPRTAASARLATTRRDGRKYMTTWTVTVSSEVTKMLLILGLGSGAKSSFGWVPPHYVSAGAPLSLQREFVAAAWGGDGGAATVDGREGRGFRPGPFTQTTANRAVWGASRGGVAAMAAAARRVSLGRVNLVCGEKFYAAGPTGLVVYGATEAALEAEFGARGWALDADDVRLQTRLSLRAAEIPAFASAIGVRYCVEKALSYGVAASWTGHIARGAARVSPAAYVEMCGGAASRPSREPSLLLLVGVAAVSDPSLDRTVDVYDAEVPGTHNFVCDGVAVSNCILNSFYGYVMRRGARWHSIQMAGVVTRTGADIIKDARILVEQIGRALELDTDGIWCMLPKTFPENFEVRCRGGKKFTLSYPCSVLNVGVYEKYTNDQYQTLVVHEDGTREYKTQSECSIYFEVDGPYKAMVLPASQHEGKGIKKRYAVFNFDGSLAELKGFEIKRRGELKLIKIFQGQVFSEFLRGRNLQECYDAVGAAANHWLDIMYSAGADLEDDDLFDLVSESKNMTQSLAEYGDAKSTSITTATRLGEFLGAEMVKDRGLNCRYIVSKLPVDTPVSQRAVPTAIFAAEESIKKHFLRRWLRDQSLTNFDIRELLDWEYYITRLGSAIQKIITIPAAFQQIENPVPRVAHPDWLRKRISSLNDPRRQTKIGSFFGKGGSMQQGQQQQQGQAPDMEDVLAAGAGGHAAGKTLATVTRRTVSSPLKERRERERAQRGRELFAGGGGGGGGGAKKKSGKAEEAADEGGDGDGTEGDDDDAPMPDNDDDDDEGDDAAMDASACGEDDDGAVRANKSGGARRPVSSPAAPSPAPEAPPPCPRMADDFAGWHRHQKGRWKALRARRKKEREQERRMAARALAQGHAGPGGMFVRREVVLRQQYWQIVQVVPDSTPGYFSVWAFVDRTRLQRVRVRVPRTIFVNAREPDKRAERRGTRVERRLPRGRPCLHLYEMTMDEDKFARKSKRLTSFLTDPNVEGVYETQVPLLFKMVCGVGCVAKMNASKVDTRDIPVDALKFKTTAECPYLEPATAQFRRVYVYHAANEGRGVLGIFLQGSADAYVLAVAPRGAQLEKPNLKRALQRARAPDVERYRAQAADAEERREAGERGVPDPVEPVPAHGFFSRTVTSHKEALRALRDRVIAFADELREPLVVVVESPMSQEELYRRVPALQEHPVVRVKPQRQDSEFEPMMWYRRAVDNMMMRYAGSHQWWHETVEFCRYAHVPIGNIEHDVPSHVCDVMYARELWARNCLLWVSPGTRPDLGGLEEDDNYFEDEYGNPEIVRRGCYRTVTVKMDVENVALSSVLQSDVLDQLEGGSFSSVTEAAAGGGGGGGGSGSGGGPAPRQSNHGLAGVSDTDSCRLAFKVLKAMVTNWFKDMVMTRNVYADQQIFHFYRWLRSPTSMLYDPSLHRLVHNMMKKMFLQLTTRLTKLGATVVYGTFNSLLVNTNKTDAEAGVEYLHYVLDTVSQRELFQYLTFTPHDVWESLLFLDTANHGGVVVSAAAEDGDGDGGGGGGGGDTTSLVSHWDLARFLPKMAEEFFLVAVGSFLDQVHEAKRLAQSPAPGQRKLTDKQLQEVMGERAKELVRVDLKRQMLRFCDEIRQELEKSAEVDRPEDTFPPRVRYWSSRRMTSPSLEFIKSVCHVLSLDKGAEDEVTLMRRNLLRLVGVRDFADEAKFRPPVVPFVLPDVICEHCNQSRDLDLCRDPELLVAEEWKCKDCDAAMDMGRIEGALVDIVQRRATQYQVQDLVCVACGRTKADNMSEFCACSAKFVCTQPADRFHADMRTFLTIAQFHGFPYLEQVAQVLLGQVPGGAAGESGRAAAAEARRAAAERAAAEGKAGGGGGGGGDNDDEDDNDAGDGYADSGVSDGDGYY